MSKQTDLIIWATSHKQSAAIAKQIQSAATEAGTAFHVQICGDLAIVLATLNTKKSARLCLVYTAPEQILSQAIYNGENLASALDNWTNTAQEILALHRHNRSHSLLFEASHLSRYFNTGLSRLGIVASELTSNPVQEQLLVDAPLLNVIAQAQLSTRPDVIALLDELNASAQLLSNDTNLASSLSADMAYQNYNTQRLRLAEAEKTISALDSEILNLRTERKSKLEMNENRISKFKDIIRQREAALKDRSEKIKELNSILKNTRNHVHTLESRISRIMESKSMRITAPLRYITNFFNRPTNE